MTERARYFDTINYTESEYAEVQNRLLPEGVLRQVGGELAATAPGGMIVRIASGEGMIQGFWYKNDANVDVTIPANSSGSTRTDNIILRLGRTANAVSLVLVPNGSAPNRTVGGDWEMLLATVTVPNGAGAIVPANLSDKRGEALCGYTGGGTAADGNAAAPGLAFTGNRATGFFRDTPAGAAGGVRLSINGAPYYYFDSYGLSINTAAPVPASHIFQTHGGYWAQTANDGAPIQYLLGNNVLTTAQTKQAIVGLGTAASQFMGGSGDLNIVTNGTASGAIILGTNYTRRMTVAPTTGHVSVGPTTGAARFNVFSSGNGLGTGIKLYHSNQQHHLDIMHDVSGSVWATIINGAGVATPNSLVIQQGTGNISVGPAISGVGKITAVQSSAAADQGFGLLWGGGIFRAYVIDEGGVVLTSASTATRHWHSINAFTSNGDNATSLGTPSFRWANVNSVLATIGGVSLSGSGADPISPDAYHLGSVNRWHTLYSLAVSAASSVSTPYVVLGQTSGVPGQGLNFTFAGVSAYQYLDAAGSWVFNGPGTSVRAQVMLVNGATTFRPLSNGGCNLGELNVRWGSIFANGNITVAGNVTSAGQSQFGTYGTINMAGDFFSNNAVLPANNQQGVVGRSQQSWDQMWCYTAFKSGGGSWAGFPSDDRAKVMEAFRPYETGLDALLRLRPTYYTFNGRYGGIEGTEYVGLRANEAREVAPELVFTVRTRPYVEREEDPEEDVLGLDTSNITYMLINAAKELHARVAALEAMLAERRN